MRDKSLRSRLHLIRYILLSTLFSLIFVLAIGIYVVCAWYKKTFDLEFKELLYTLASPLKGTGESTVDLIVRSCLPSILIALGFAVIVAVAVYLIKHRIRILAPGCALLSLCLLVACSIFGVYALRIPAYIKIMKERTTIYEEQYVDPESVAITAEGETKNLIYIYLESMETAYTSKSRGGAQLFNYIPGLYKLAEANVSFSSTEKLGGFHTPLGTGWTMAALLATTSGIPFSFPLGENGQNAMSRYEYFASGLTTLGDILEEKGYRQEFLCGSDAAFAGRDNYFSQHGNYEIFDYNTAIEEGYIEKDYYVWWGLEDQILYEIAKDELTELAASGEPFNFTMLTVDTHHVNGYFCSSCESKYTSRLGNVLACADRQITEFVSWIMEQDFYEDSVIVITGDHPRMDTTLVGKLDYDDRTIYNCFINSAVTPIGETVNRTFTSFDIFPTTLAALGFNIEGDRLGLGVNMFSGLPTLAEMMGYKELETEINKYSEYYILEFS